MKGASLISVLVCGTILATVIYYFSVAVSSTQQTDTRNQQTLAAELLVAELIEYLRSARPNQILQHLATNPINGATTPNKLYKFCSHINILDRTNKKLVNEDPIAKLSKSVLAEANRFYLIQIVNLKTLSVSKNYCNQTARKSDGTLMTISDLLPDERLQITVGVTWIPASTSEKKKEPIERIVITTVIPG